MICSGFLRATARDVPPPRTPKTKGRQSPLDGSVFHLPGSFTCEARALFLGAGAPIRAVRCAAVGANSHGAPIHREELGTGTNSAVIASHLVSRAMSARVTPSAEAASADPGAPAARRFMGGVMAVESWPPMSWSRCHGRRWPRASARARTTPKHTRGLDTGVVLFDVTVLIESVQEDCGDGSSA
jgi:hypothetical protein